MEAVRLRRRPLEFRRDLTEHNLPEGSGLPVFEPEDGGSHVQHWRVGRQSVSTFAAKRPNTLRWVAAAAVSVAIVEAAFIGRMFPSWRLSGSRPFTAAVVVDSPQRGAEVLVDGRSVGVTPLALKVGLDTRSIQVRSHPEMTPSPTLQALQAAGETGNPSPSNNARAPAERAAPASQFFGGVKLLSPIELQVMEGERRMGSSLDGPIVANVGLHDFDLVNTKVGFRARRTVEIKSGQIVVLSVTPPNGSVTINAVPWAQVWIDGNAAGVTPITKLSVAPGEHEILFRHPQLGERREKAVVRSDETTRVSANLQRSQ